MFLRLCYFMVLETYSIGFEIHTCCPCFHLGVDNLFLKRFVSYNCWKHVLHAKVKLWFNIMAFNLLTFLLNFCHMILDLMLLSCLGNDSEVYIFTYWIFTSWKFRFCGVWSKWRICVTQFRLSEHVDWFDDNVCNFGWCSNTFIT